MGKVTVQEYTTKLPLTLMGFEAGVCWGADTADDWKNRKRGYECVISGHGRVEEYPQVYLVLEGYSARVIREFYTHIAGGPTRLQESTRYINCGKFNYITPPSILKNEETKKVYDDIMANISSSYQALEDLGISKEDIANILPLGMTSKIVVRTNMRHLIDMSHQRLCARAYWEFRQLMNDIQKALKEYSEEWSFIVDTQMKAKCDICGYCEEKNSCGKAPRKEALIEGYKRAIAAQRNLWDDGK